MKESMKGCIRAPGSHPRFVWKSGYLAPLLALYLSGALQTAQAVGPVAPPPKVSPVAPPPAVIPSPRVPLPVMVPVIPAPVVKAPAKGDTAQADGTSDTTGTPQAISDQAASGNLSSFMNTSGNSGTDTPKKQELAPSYLPDAPFLNAAGTSGTIARQKQEEGSNPIPSNTRLSTDNAGQDESSGAVYAPISTTRSNIKHGTSVLPEGDQGASPAPMENRVGPYISPSNSGSSPARMEDVNNVISEIGEARLKTVGNSGNGSPSPQETAGTPIQGTPVGLDHDPEGMVTSVKTNGRGVFSMGKLAPGRYILKLSGKDISLPNTGGTNPQSILIGLLLPAVQKARVVEHAIPGNTPPDKLSLRVALTVGKDGSVMALDWGDGKGPVDLAKEGDLIPIPEGVQPGELRGALAAGKGQSALVGTFRLGWRF